jgi:2-polyprenyl-3-methyl-5-hydroxy-6-metoxy-1,4-benzoquinol methylase
MDEQAVDAKVASHYDAIADEWHKQYQRENLETSAEYPANYFRLQILTQRLAASRISRVYEIGVGEGTPLVTMAKMGFSVAGCDISQAMVAKARENFEANGLSPGLIQWGDIEDATTYAAQLADGRFDAVIAAGVLPHIRNDRLFLRNLHMLLKPGGKVLIEFRNKLFSLFTFNRLTKEFILDDLLRDVASDVKAAVATELDKRLALDLPRVRSTARDFSGREIAGPGYDLILSKFHNPFELMDVFRENGFRDVRVHWYHYHPALPMLESALGERFRSEAMRLEHESSWRGFFLCSAGVIEAELA